MKYYLGKVRTLMRLRFVHSNAHHLLNRFDEIECEEFSVREMHVNWQPIETMCPFNFTNAFLLDMRVRCVNLSK